ncbi:hypothetical protein D5R81_13530 [Parashewanella spongiae]|uniref:Uncharacterized protein n=2 Tax=Parashewanella spongiae TaxID=342950 RepID=A0A3A6TRI8_9GAMM|nr:hypothetical protein [Parashewanella spongiae]MCL1079249.1 hypothetical protein [Parashewanella spongiae]RJY11080.1 hypothetical protein D5R81_13530 [Parashewanella spongiae]
MDEDDLSAWRIVDDEVLNAEAFYYHTGYPYYRLYENGEFGQGTLEYEPPTAKVFTCQRPQIFDLQSEVKPTDQDWSSSSQEFYHTEKDWSMFAQELDEKAIRVSEGTQSMPCMAETSKVILSQIDLYLAAQWLNNTEKEAINYYKQQVQALKDKNYPYKESLKLALEFTLVQDVFNILSIPHVSEEEAKEIRNSSIGTLIKDWDKEAENYAKSQRFYGVGREFGPLSLANIIYQDWDVGLFGISNSEAESVQAGHKTWHILQAIFMQFSSEDVEQIFSTLKTVSEEKLVVPAFCGFSVKTMNLSQNTALVPVGLTIKRSEKHDIDLMSSSLLAFHDLLHESRIKSGIMKSNIEKKLGHTTVISLYNNSKQVDEYIHFIAENIAFIFGHELGKLLTYFIESPLDIDLDESNLKMFIGEYLPNNLLPHAFSVEDENYNEKALEGLKWLKAHVLQMFVPHTSNSSVLAVCIRLRREIQLSVSNV